MTTMIDTAAPAMNPMAPTESAPTESAPIAAPDPAPAPVADWRAAVAGGDADALKRLERFSDAPQMLRALSELEARNLPKPQENWGSEQWNDFYTRLGRPQSVEGYKIEVTLPNDATADMRTMVESRLQDVRAAAHEAGLTPQQWSRLSQYVQESVTGELGALQKQAMEYRQQAEQMLRAEWGADFERNLDYAKASLNEFQRETGVDAAGLFDLSVMMDGKQLKLGDFAPFVKLMSAVGRRFGDDPYFVQARSGSGDPVGDLQAKLDQYLDLRTKNPAEYERSMPEILRISGALAAARGRAA